MAKSELERHEEDGLIGFFVIFGLAIATILGAVGCFGWWIVTTIIS